MYFLPKIHKGITPPPGRPIVSANGCPIQKMSKFVDHFLNTPSTLNKSYVNYTTHFLKFIRDAGVVPPNGYLVTLDVMSLYTNIPTPSGIQAAKEILQKFRPNTGLKPSNDSLLKLLECILTKNNFQFDNQHFLQIKECAMGTRVARSFTYTYMAKFEDDHVYTYCLQMFMYLRYLDDNFLIWQHGLEKLHKFVEHLNSRMDSLLFMMIFSRESTHFLDITVKFRAKHCIQICTVNQLTHTVTCFTTLPIHITVRKVSLTVNY